MYELSNFKRKHLLFNGIYKITNIINNKSYIGSCSSRTFLYDRIKHHQQDLLNNKHCNTYLQRSFNKYGIDNFKFEILEECKPEDCIVREQYYIDTLNPEYNILKLAGSSLGVKCSIEKANKISESNKIFWNNPENKKRMKEAFKNRRKRAKKLKIKKLYHGGCKKVIDMNTNIVYNSVIELSENLKLTYCYLISVLNNRRKSPNLNIKYIA